MLSEPPQPFAVPLPRECSISNNHAHSYNQGQCSRRPCQTDSGPCNYFWRCCYEVGQVSTVPFVCSDSARDLLGSMIVTCECQPCEKLHAYIRGRVLSSNAHDPVMLAAVLLRNEIVAFTDESGRFFFELSTVEGEVNLLFQEVRHRQVSVDVNLRTSLTPDIAVTMEYIKHVEVVDRLQAGFHTELGTLATSEQTGINASIAVPRRALLSPKSYEVYEGPGYVLHSLYHMDSRPEFTSAAIQSMVYRDSKGADFSIQSHITGSMQVVGETGEAMNLKQGSYITLTVAISFDRLVESSQVEGLHIFTYPDRGNRWVDNGKVAIDMVQQSQYSTRVLLHAKLRDSNLVWTVGFPSRITCYIKSRVYHMLTNQEIVDMSVQLEQSMINLDRPSFYLASAKTLPGEGVCLQAVCELGGLVYIMDTAVGEEVSRVALTPSTRHGVIMGDGDQVMFYDVQRPLITSDSSTPYYPSEVECSATHPAEGKTGYFEFLVNISLPKLANSFSFLPLLASDSEASPSPSTHTGTCYIKVGVYDCSQDVTIQVLSYSSTNHTHLLSMLSETLPGDHERFSDGGPCQDSNLMHLRSACLKYTCGADLHVSAVTWSPTGQNERLSSRSSRSAEQEGGCRYWSSHSALSSRMHLGDAMASFHLQDRTSEHVSGDGLYLDLSEELALQRCQAGNNKHPFKMDQSNGVAVTFICY